MSYLLLNRFRSLFEGVRYRHRDSSLGDSVAWCLPEDLYGLKRSPKFNARVRAWNEPPHAFEWVDEKQTEMDYGAALTRIIRKYDVRF